MEKLRCFFNLIALLVEKARKFDDYRHTQRISDDEAIKVNIFVDELIYKYFNPSVKDIKKRLSITQDIVEKILREFEDRHFYFFSALITRLDKLLSLELLYNLLKHNPMEGDDITESYFESLNDNSDQTGICIYPNFALMNTSTNKCGRVLNRKARLENDLKSSLDNIFYVTKSALKGYKIVNAVLDCQLKDKDFITVAVTPLCNTKEEELIKINHYQANHNGVDIKLLTTELKDTQKSNKKFKEVLLKCIDEGDVDIVMGPEVLGTKEFSVVDRYGYNDEIRQIGGKSPPSVIIPSTYVHDSSNVLSVFYNSGEKLGEQHKQEPFDDKKSKEDLRNAKREIFVLHICGIGRICFLICRDFLTEYADVIINELKANLILCPSYSRGARNFNASKMIATGHDCRVVWINCCSAFTNRRKKGAFIGFAAGNYIPDSTTYLKCGESSECNGCYFKIKIPLNALNEEYYNDKKITLQHKKF